MIGERFGRLTVMSVEREKSREFCVCRCDCGGEKRVRASSLRAGYTRSCGCLAREIWGKASTTHGLSASTEWITWHSMHQRCENPKHKSFPSYGGRGIRVCSRWSGEGGFLRFVRDMGRRPSSDHSLDRINNDGPYSPKNCRWATRSEQAKNRRPRADGRFQPKPHAVAQ